MPVDSLELPAGIYLADNKVYRVRNRRGAAPLVQQLQIRPGRAAGSFVPAPREACHLTSSHQITPEQARNFGHTYTVCCACGRRLTHPESVARGVGPVCAARFGL